MEKTYEDTAVKFKESFQKETIAMVESANI